MSNDLPKGYSLEIIDTSSGYGKGGINQQYEADFRVGFSPWQIYDKRHFLTINEDLIDPTTYIEKSTIQITAETELDKNIVSGELTINWVKPQFNILEISNNGVIKYKLDTKFECSIQFEIIPQAQIDYTFKPDWNKVTHEITELDPALADKIYIEFSSNRLF